MPRNTKTNERQERFCLAYTNLDAPTYHNALKSAIAAGYSERSAGTQGSQQLKKKHVKARVDELDARRCEIEKSQQQYGLAELQNEFLQRAEKYEAANDHTNALRALEDYARTIGAFKDVTVSVEATERLGEHERAEAHRLANLLLDAEPVAALPAPEPVTIDAVTEPVLSTLTGVKVNDTSTNISETATKADVNDAE